MATRGDGGLAGRLTGLGLFLGLGWLAVAVDLAPFPRVGWRTPGPDLLVCVAAFWVVRRPAEAPAAAVFALGLARDLVGGAPLGAGALGLLAATEALRARGATLRRRGLVVEWPAAAAAAAAAPAVASALVVLSLSPAPDAAALAAAWAATALAYGPVALAMRHLLRLSTRAGPGEGDPMFARGRP